jgi:hypothetical protein
MVGELFDDHRQSLPTTCTVGATSSNLRRLVDRDADWRRRGQRSSAKSEEECELGEGEHCEKISEMSLREEAERDEIGLLQTRESLYDFDASRGRSIFHTRLPKYMIKNLVHFRFTQRKT